MTLDTNAMKEALDVYRNLKDRIDTYTLLECVVSTYEYHLWKPCSQLSEDGRTYILYGKWKPFDILSGGEDCLTLASYTSFSSNSSEGKDWYSDFTKIKDFNVDFTHGRPLPLNPQSLDLLREPSFHWKKSLPKIYNSAREAPTPDSWATDPRTKLVYSCVYTLLEQLEIQDQWTSLNLLDLLTYGESKTTVYASNFFNRRSREDLVKSINRAVLWSIIGVVAVVVITLLRRYLE